MEAQDHPDYTAKPLLLPSSGAGGWFTESPLWTRYAPGAPPRSICNGKRSSGLKTPTTTMWTFPKAMDIKQRLLKG